MNLLAKIFFTSSTILGIVGCVDAADDTTITADDLDADELRLGLVDGRVYTFSPVAGPLDLTRISIGPAALERLLEPVVGSTELRGMVVTVETSVENGKYRFDLTHALYLPDGVAARPNTGGGGTCLQWVQWWSCTDTNESSCTQQTDCARWQSGGGGGTGD